jgi:hypothetical protein
MRGAGRRGHGGRPAALLHLHVAAAAHVENRVGYRADGPHEACSPANPLAPPNPRERACVSAAPAQYVPRYPQVSSPPVHQPHDTIILAVSSYLGAGRCSHSVDDLFLVEGSARGTPRRRFPRG